MAAVTLEEVKARSSVIHDLNDGMLTQMIDEAEAEASTFIKRPIPWLDDGVAVDVPADVKSAIILRVAQRYRSRDGEVVDGFDEAFRNLLWPYRMQGFF